MKKILFLLPTTILATTLAIAQNTPNSSNTQSSTPAQSAPSDQTGNTMRGCLGGSTGNYTFTDSHTGTVYNLTGSTEDLGSKVGHEVEITGQLASSASTSDSTNNNSGTSSTSGSDATRQKRIQLQHLTGK